MEVYSFRQCTLTQLDRTFGLHRVFSSQILDQWLQCEIALSAKEKENLQDFQTLLIINSDSWNEQELSLNFISPLFALAHFSEPYRFNLFAERKIGAVIPGLHDDVDLSGEPDGMIATGYREPEIPLFAFRLFRNLNYASRCELGAAHSRLFHDRAAPSSHLRINFPFQSSIVISSE